MGKLLFRLALRNALRNRRRSAYTVAAVSFGLFCLMIFQALKVGLHEEMVRSTVNLDAGSVAVHPAGYEPNLAALLPLKDPGLVEKAAVESGTSALARRIRTPGLVLAGEKSAGVLISGIDTASEPKITFIKDRVTKGAYPGEGGGLLISENLAGPLKAAVGDEIALMAQDSSGKAVVRRFRVAGEYRTALASFDRSHVFLPSGELGSFLRADGVSTEVAMRAGEGGAEALAAALRTKLDPAIYKVMTWKEIAPDVDQLIRLNDSTMELLIAIVFAIVAMGIVNTMSMAVYERFHEIGVMLAMGAGPRTVFSLFLIESTALGFLSALVGSVAGLAACYYLSIHGVDLTSLTSSNEYFATSHVLKAHIRLYDVIWENALTVLTAVAAGVFPALKAVRLEAVEAINHV